MIRSVKAAGLAAALACCAAPAWSADPPRVTVEFHRVENRPGPGLKEVAVPGRDQKVYLHPEADLTNRDIATARVAEGPALELSFTPEGQQKAARLSERHLNRSMAVLIDGKVVSVHVVRAKFTDRAVITGSLDKEEVERIVAGVHGK